MWGVCSTSRDILHTAEEILRTVKRILSTGEGGEGGGGIETRMYRDISPWYLI